MGDRYSDLVRALREAVLGGRGHTRPELRRAVAARASALSGAGAPGEPVPGELSGFVDKVARHAYRVTAEDVTALRLAGYSEDQIFEIAVSAAAGAGLGRLERGISALRGTV